MPTSVFPLPKSPKNISKDPTSLGISCPPLDTLAHIIDPHASCYHYGGQKQLHRFECLPRQVWNFFVWAAVLQGFPRLSHFIRWYSNLSRQSRWRPKIRRSIRLPIHLLSHRISIYITSTVRIGGSMIHIPYLRAIGAVKKPVPVSISISPSSSAQECAYPL